MSTTSAPARRRRGFGRPTDDAGPRARFSQLLPYLLEHKRVLAFVIVLSILGAAASLAQPLLVSQVIEVVGKQEPLGGLVWGLIALVVISGIISGYQHYLLQRTGEGVVLSSRRKLVGRLLRLPISEFDTRRTGDLVSRVGSDTTLLRAVLTQGLVEAIGGALTFIGALIAMLIIDPVLLGLTVLVVAVSIVVVVLLSGRIRVASQKAQNKVGDLAAAVERAISSVRTIRASNATEREIAAVDEDATGAWRMGIRVAKISALVVPVAGIAMQVSFLVVLGVGGFRVASGAITVANLVAFILFLFMMILPLGQAFGAIAAVNSALGALGRIQEILDLPTEDQHDRDIAPLALTVGAANEALAPEAPAIEFVDVRFAYPEGTAPEDSADGSRTASGGQQQTPEQPTPERLAFEALTGADVVAEAEAAAGAGSDEGTHWHGGVLQGVSFRVPRGKRTALVGPSGAGKSTILALVERFYDPQAGEVRFGGMDVRTLDRVSLRSQIGYVEQDAPVLAGSLRDNLTLAAPGATDQECIDVLHAVNLTEVLERSELGLGAPVGEDGIMLSGGERQRLAIARALLAAPPVLLLDESTSSLDGRNEQLMREAIDAVAEDRTLLVIAHRLSTVVDSDQIVVLDHGRVIGSGTHSELVETTPLYRDLAKHQLLV
ncbi:MULTISPECIES: ABC transporter ATP-binding protein [unclassified Leifsonia]|uniref:ABC transporter ATP-binding protein n=1 Tax=unclassified Leifsonia TaxID=2663824 RepID=UPI0003627E7B|nr:MULTISPECIES: ABC transporter ATP-binding protein [unclassified Leifsonia]TDQ02781.1 ATP-binding cassette subfamily B protein [Leifsonia sp. 115AMFTsu3.1]